MKHSPGKKLKEEVAWWQPSLILFSRLSLWIGAPIIFALFIGKWLDERYQTEPWLFLFSIGVAFIGSSVGITKEAKKAIEKIEKEEGKKKGEVVKKEETSDLK